MRSLFPGAAAVAALSLIGVALLQPAPAAAQWRADRFADRAATAEQPDARPSWRLLRIAKWTTAATALGTGIYGFVLQDDADSRFRELEDLCEVERERCRELEPDGSYADPGLESRYQRIREDYRTARVLLVVSQVALAGSIALFILDLPDDPTPRNVPYEPERLDFGVRSGMDGRVLLEGRWRY